MIPVSLYSNGKSCKCTCNCPYSEANEDAGSPK